MLHQEFMKKNKTNILSEIIGWIGVILIALSYFLLAFEIIDGRSLVYHSLIFVGATFVAILSYRQRIYQPALLNTFFSVLAAFAILKILFA